jgi:hypothetical protein
MLEKFVFELWQTAVKSQGKTITSSAVMTSSTDVRHIGGIFFALRGTF